MVGLSVVLENQTSSITSSVISKKTPQVISKTSMLVSHPTAGLRSSGSHPLPLPPPTFLDHCCLCHEKLLPGKDIYMYQGDRAFCSVDCRCRQIFMDDQAETSNKQKYCSLAAIKPPATASASASSSSSTASGYRRKAGRNRAGGFAY